MTLPPWRSYWDRGPEFALCLPVAAAGISSRRFLFYLRLSVELTRQEKVFVLRELHHKRMRHQTIVNVCVSLHREHTEMATRLNSGRLESAAMTALERRLFRAWSAWFDVVLSTPDLPWET